MKEPIDSEGSAGSPEGRVKEPYFAFSAALRIFGNIPSLDGITERLGVTPTESHSKGDRGWGAQLPPYAHDMWSYRVEVGESEPLHVHIDALWKVFRVHKSFLIELKQSATVDVFLTYTSDCGHAGVVVPYQSLEMFRELEVPFGLSIVVI